MHLVCWTLVVKRTLILPYFVQYMDNRNAEKPRSPHTCFATHILQNKKLLSLKQWHLKIGYTDIIMSFNVLKLNPVTIVIENSTVKKRNECKPIPALAKSTHVHQKC